MRLPHKTLEKSLFAKGYKNIIAVDEVGMGSLAGPVVICAVQFNKRFFQKKHKNLHWLRDSKLLLPHQRESFVRELLKEENLKHRIGYCYPKTIDQVNIYRAARLAMKRAVKKFGHKARDVFILVDGPGKINGLEFEQMPVVKGDRRVFSIACASLIAKVFRDRMMTRYAKRFSDYGFEKHKGYGTKLHRAMLIRHGRSPIHRNSFRLVY